MEKREKLACRIHGKQLFIRTHDKSSRARVLSLSLFLFPILPLHAPVHDYATLNRGIKKEVSEVQISFHGSERAPGELR